MHKTDEAVLSLLTGNPRTDDNFAAIFYSLERTPSNKLNFPYPDINKFTLHTLQKLFTLYTLFTDVKLFSGVIETLLTKFAIPSIWQHFAPFYASLPHVQTYQITKTNRSHKKPVWRAILSQNRMEVRFVTAVTREFFPASYPITASPFISLPTTGKKNPLAPRVHIHGHTHKKNM